MPDDNEEKPSIGRFLTRYEYLLIYIAIVTTVTMLVALFVER